MVDGAVANNPVEGIIVEIRGLCEFFVRSVRVAFSATILVWGVVFLPPLRSWSISVKIMVKTKPNNAIVFLRNILLIFLLRL